MPHGGHPGGHRRRSGPRARQGRARQWGTGRDVTGWRHARIVNLPNRRSFCPDAAFWTGAPLTKKFLDGAPIFAVEVRSDEDYGPAAERALAAKRADHFTAGTLVVWDVDLRAMRVHVYRSSNPANPTSYGHGEQAEAGPAVPGWSMAVDDLTPPL